MFDFGRLPNTNRYNIKQALVQINRNVFFKSFFSNDSCFINLKVFVQFFLGRRMKLDPQNFSVSAKHKYLYPNVRYYLSEYSYYIHISKLDWVTPLVAEPRRWNSTTRQNPPICNQPVYIAVTLKLIVIFFVSALNLKRFRNNSLSIKIEEEKTQ